MGRSTHHFAFSRFERWGMAYSFSATLLLLLAITAGSLVPGPAVPVCLGLVLAYILTGFGLLVSLAMRPWLRRDRPKTRPVSPVVAGTLWDRQFDG